MERYFSTDVLVDILERLPSSSRRRFRLVCRHWRDLVDNRTTEMHGRAKPLIWDTYSAEAYVVGNYVSSPSKVNCRRIADSANYFKAGMQLVGICNGLVCLCSNNKPGGAIMVVNPATSEKLRISPLRRGAGQFVGSGRRPAGWDKAYSFGYHPITGRYKVVHVPCSFDRVCEFAALHVLTLGEAGWREVPIMVSGDTKCNLNAGIISVDGTTYWFTEGDSVRIMSFDLEDERVTATTQLPTLPARRDRYHLTEVNGRLAVAIWDGSVTTEVWGLEKQTWSRWYRLGLDIPRPHFAYGKYFLTHQSLSFQLQNDRCTTSSGERRVVHVHQDDRSWIVAKITGELYCYRVFAYVKTTEPLDGFRRKQLDVNTANYSMTCED